MFYCYDTFGAKTKFTIENCLHTAGNVALLCADDFTNLQSVSHITQYNKKRKKCATIFMSDKTEIRISIRNKLLFLPVTIIHPCQILNDGYSTKLYKLITTACSTAWAHSTQDERDKNLVHS